MERTFLFLGSARKDIRAVWRGFNSDSVLRKLFSGDLDFRKTETNLFLHFVRAEEGSGEESARASVFFGWVGGYNQNCYYAMSYKKCYNTFVSQVVWINAIELIF